MTHEFRMIRRVQFAETDMAGVLHFSNYYRYMEEVEHAFWRSIGRSVVMPDHSGEHISWPRVATSCEYAAPAHFEDEIELGFAVVMVGERSVTYQVEFHRQGRRIAVGRTTAVCCMMSNGSFRPIPIPDAIRAKLAELAASADIQNAS